MHDRIATKCMLSYLQSWGQSANDRIEALNAAVADAGIKAKFEQGPNGENAGWRGDKAHADLAIEFRQRLHRDVWCGEFNQEVRNVRSLINEFKAKARAVL